MSDLDYLQYAGSSALQAESDAKAAWLRQRCGRLTSSRMCDAMAFTKGTDKKPSEPMAKRNQLMKELCAERVTQQNVRHYVSPEMMWGVEQEPHARAEYEAETGSFVNYNRWRFTLHPDRRRFQDMLGASDDGFVDADGVIEIKCPKTENFIDWCMAKEVPDQHKPQMIIILECTQREWADFIAYDPRVKPPGQRMFIRRYAPDKAEREVVLAHAERFLNELDEMFFAFTHG